MHAGYISGWFEASFGMKVVAVETACRAMGQKNCQFLICHENNVKKHVPPHMRENSTLVSVQTEDSVASLLSKFRENRKNSDTPRPPDASGNPIPTSVPSPQIKRKRKSVEKNERRINQKEQLKPKS